MILSCSFRNLRVMRDCYHEDKKKAIDLNDNLKPVLVLDLDGTLIDSKPDLVAAVNAAIKVEGLPAVPMEVVGETVGQGARAMIARVFEHHQKTLTKETGDRLFTLLLDYYTNNVAVYSTPYAGVQVALDKFRDNGWLLAVCTNKPEKLARLLLQATNMDTQFSAICGLDTFDVCKPDGGHIIKTIEMAGGNLARSVMVGDTATDINAAINAKISSIVVDFGYSAIPVGELGATNVISHFDELWPAIQAFDKYPTS